MENTRCICNDGDDDKVMPWMVQELKLFAEKGHIFEFDEAWFRYRELTRESWPRYSSVIQVAEGFFKK